MKLNVPGLTVEDVGSTGVIVLDDDPVSIIFSSVVVSDENIDVFATSGVDVDDCTSILVTGGVSDVASGEIIGVFASREVVAADTDCDINADVIVIIGAVNEGVDSSFVPDWEVVEEFRSMHVIVPA